VIKMQRKLIRKQQNTLTQSILFSLLACSAHYASAQDYSFSDLGTVNGAYAGMTVAGINNHGQVVGGDGVTTYIWNGETASALDSTPNVDSTSGNAINDAGQVAGGDYTVAIDRGFPIRWDGTTATIVPTLGGGFISSALTINNNGQMAGSSYFGGSFQPVRWDFNTIVQLNTLGGSAGAAGGINDAGIVVGQSRTTSDEATHATIWNGTTASDLGTLGGTGSAAIDINNNGQIVGWGHLSGDQSEHGIFWNSSTATAQDLGTLGGDTSAAQAINDLAQIVGYSTLANGDTHAVLWNDTSTPIDLNSYLPTDLTGEGWVMAYGFGINNNGDIIGYLTNSGDANLAAAFKLTAVPLPSAVLLFGSVLSGFLFNGRRQSKLIRR
jgi:probable HAF family extracellular repeat protein